MHTKKTWEVKSTSIDKKLIVSIASSENITKNPDKQITVVPVTKFNNIFQVNISFTSSASLTVETKNI